MTSPDAVLFLHRFLGTETYPVASARWNLYQDELEDGTECASLCLFVRAEAGTRLHEDTETLRARPHWELNVLEVELDVAALVPGAVFELPEGYDELRGGHLTNFYYCAHQDTEANCIEVLAVDGPRLKLRVRGETTDVNYYDGSKPPTKLALECWFERDASLQRSMS